MNFRLLCFVKKNKFIFLIILLPVIFFWSPLINKEVLYWGTSSTQFFPWMEFAINDILNGQIPLWNPYNGWGAPFLANYQTAIFYPLNWIVILVYKISNGNNYFWIYTILLVIHLQIGSVGFYKLLSKFNLSEMSKTFGVIVFIFSGYLMARINFISMIWSAVWFPWIVSEVIGIFKSTSIKPGKINLSLVFVIGMQLLSGHAQTTYYTFLFSAWLFFILWLFSKQKMQHFVEFATSYTLAVFLSAIQLIPTAEYLLHSQRSQEVGFDYALNFSLWPWRIFSALFPDLWGNPNFGRYIGGGNYWEDHLYLGVFSLIFVFIGGYLILYKKTSENIIDLILYRFCLALMPVSIFFALGKNFFIFPLFYKYVPTFDMFQAPSRFLLLYTLCGAIISAYGFENWIKTNYKPKKTGLFVIVFIAVLFGVVLGTKFIEGLPKSLIYSVEIGSLLCILFGFLTILKNFLPPQLFKIIPILILFIVYFDLSMFNYQSQLFVPKNFYQGFSFINRELKNENVFIDKKSEEFLKYNQLFRFDRFSPLTDLSANKFFVLPNTNLFSPSYSLINNFDPFVPERYARFIDYISTMRESERKKLLNKLGVTIYVSNSNITKKGDLSLEQLNYENIVHWYDCFELSAPDKILYEFVNNTLLGNNQCQLLDSNIGFNPFEEESDQNSPALTLIKRNNQEYILNYNSSQKGWITINHTWYPGWKAILDQNIELEVYQADYMFLGIELPKGEHNLRLIYDPLSFKIGFYISFFSLLLFTSIIIFKIFVKIPEYSTIKLLIHRGETNGPKNSTS